MSNRFDKKLLLIIFIIAMACSCFLVGCVKIPNAIYDGSIIYEVNTIDEYDAEVYMPKNVTFTRGMIFYVGTAMPPSSYSNLAKQLASRGYYVAFPKVSFNFTYIGYEADEKVLDNRINLKFAIAGHSQGGGAAAKRLAQGKYSLQTIGGIFLSPLFYKDNDLRESSKPALLIEAENDKILSQSMKDNARKFMPNNLISHMILGGNHMAYSSMTFPADGKLAITEEEQQNLTVNYILDFLSKLTW